MRQPIIRHTFRYQGPVQFPNMLALGVYWNVYWPANILACPMADHYFDIAFSSVEEVWSDRSSLSANAPDIVQEVSEAAAQVDPIAALQRSERLQDPSAEAISMLAVARVVVGQP